MTLDGTVWDEDSPDLPEVPPFGDGLHPNCECYFDYYDGDKEATGLESNKEESDD